jgi:acyl-CoA thioesterase FadM
VPQEASVIRSRVWFNDLDPFGHMNNGRYLTLMDLGRTDLMVRSGLARAAFAHKWTPIASAVLIRFRRELRLLQKFRIETRIVYWSERLAVLEQVFVFVGGAYDGQVAARALFKGGLYDRPSKQFIPVARLMAEVGIVAQEPQLTGEIAAYLNADEEMKRAGRMGAEA